MNFLSIFTQIFSIASKIIPIIYNIIKKYPWIIFLFIFLAYIIYLHLQIYSYKSDINFISNQLTIKSDSIDAYQTIVIKANNQNQMIKALLSQKDSLSNEMIKLIKTNKYKLNEVINIKFKETKYSTGDTLQDGIIEKVDDQFKIIFSKKFENAFVEGYVLYPSAKFKLIALFKPSDMKIIKINDNNIEKIYAYPFSGSNIESLTVVSVPSVINQPFYKKFDLDELFLINHIMH
jgi:hypothetical protein